MSLKISLKIEVSRMQLSDVSFIALHFEFFVVKGGILEIKLLKIIKHQNLNESKVNETIQIYKILYYLYLKVITRYFKSKDRMM